MQLGLVRHFRVNHKKPQGWLTADQFDQWVNHYDEAPIDATEVVGNLDWELCFTSDLPRAFHTASSLCNCEIMETPLLREIPLTAFSQKKMRLPLVVWILAGRAASFYSHSSQEETRSQTSERLKQCIELLESSQKNRVLVVSHGFFLLELSKALEKSGYTGKRKRYFKNGELLLFEK